MQSSGFYSRKDETLRILPDSLNGNEFSMANLNTCDVYILDNCGDITVDHCTNCHIRIGPINGACSLSHCTNTTISAACKQFYTRNSHDITVYIYCSTVPVIEETANILFGPFNHSYPGQDRHFVSAEIDISVNMWREVHDLSLAETGGSNWGYLSLDEYTEERTEVAGYSAPCNPVPSDKEYVDAVRKVSNLLEVDKEVSDRVEIPPSKQVEKMVEENYESSVGKILEDLDRDVLTERVSIPQMTKISAEDARFETSQVAEVISNIYDMAIPAKTPIKADTQSVIEVKLEQPPAGLDNAQKKPSIMNILKGKKQSSSEQLSSYSDFYSPSSSDLSFFSSPSDTNRYNQDLSSRADIPSVHSRVNSRPKDDIAAKIILKGGIDIPSVSKMALNSITPGKLQKLKSETAEDANISELRSELSENVSISELKSEPAESVIISELSLHTPDFNDNSESTEVARIVSVDFESKEGQNILRSIGSGKTVQILSPIRCSSQGLISVCSQTQETFDHSIINSELKPELSEKGDQSSFRSQATTEFRTEGALCTEVSGIGIRTEGDVSMFREDTKDLLIFHYRHEGGYQSDRELPGSEIFPQSIINKTLTSLEAKIRPYNMAIRDLDMTIWIVLIGALWLLTLMMILRCIEEWYTVAWSILVCIVLGMFIGVEIFTFCMRKNTVSRGEDVVGNFVEDENLRMYVPRKARLMADLRVVKIRLPVK